MTELGSEESLEQRWRVVLGAGSGLFNLFDSGHPLPIYIGGNGAGEPTLTIVLKERPPTLAKFNLLSIDTRRREDGTWLLLLQLQSKAAFREFVTMCGDLIAASRGADTSTSALEKFLVSLDHWRKLFKPATDDLLTESELRGLAAELTCMRGVLRPGRTWADVVQGWVGPLRAPQDFRLSGSTLVEVKAVHRNSVSTKISSLEQLDGAEERLFLVTVEIERSVEEQSGATTVPAMVSGVESELFGNFELLDEFRMKLHELGFNPDEQIYETFHFTVGGSRIYRVDESFPRLKRADIPIEILRAEYDLALADLAPHLLAQETVI